MLAPLEVRRHTSVLHKVIDDFRPDLLHALRLPFEAFAAAASLGGIAHRPAFAVSTWGNDLTLHAPSNPVIRWVTRNTLAQADGLHSDCQRDIDLAASWGWTSQGPTLLVPGSGGLDLQRFRPGPSTLATRHGWRVDEPVVLNPRGLRGYVRTDVYLRALPLVHARVPDARFVSTGVVDLPGLAELPVAVRERVLLLPQLDPDAMADTYRAATVCVSPSLHDGTPNSLLEAMATGCLPVVHPVESVLEWVQHKHNGLVVDARDPRSVADGLVQALRDEPLRSQAAQTNRRMVEERAEPARCAAAIDTFYMDTVEASRRHRVRTAH